MPSRTIEKPDENLVFFEVFAAHREGQPRRELSQDEEQTEALIAKRNWESKHPDKQLVHFHEDPFAGGLVPHHQRRREMTAKAMWVGDIITRQFRDEADKQAWLEEQNR